MRLALIAFAAIAVLIGGCTQPAESRQRNHDFSGVTTCQDDFSEVNFCDERHVRDVREALAGRSADFNRKYLVVKFAEGPARTSFAAVGTRDGMVYPLPFDSFGPFVDVFGAPVRSPQAKVEYRVDSDVICFTGSTYDYRNVLENRTTCFRMKPSGFEQL